MNYRLKTVAISSIDITNTTFFISTDTDNRLLQASIKRVGLLNPPYLYFDATQQQYCIVCGYRRIMACMACGWENISAYIVDADMKESEIFLLGLYDNLAHRMLNAVERAYATQKLLTYFSPETVIRDYFPRMGLPPTYKTLEHMQALAGLDPETQKALVNNTLTEALAVKLAQQDAADRSAFLSLLSQVHLSAAKQEEVFAYCSDIAVRDGVSCREILNAQQLWNIMNQQTLNRTQKGDRVRFCLRKMRFPRLTRCEETFAQNRKQLRLPPGVTLSPPPFFEGGSFCLRIEFQDAPELADKTTHILNLIKDNRFTDVLAVW